MAANSSHPDVFLSFRGEDVRRCFVSHLHKALKSKTINAFMDENIEKGNPIGPTLSHAIKNSRISIVVFSENYASSIWCLDELKEIYKCSLEPGKTVIPIFYYVKPGDVRNQKGEFGKFFVKTCEDGTEDDKRRWMRALKDVANLAGEVLQNWHNDALLIEHIVSVVSKKLVSGTGSTNAQSQVNKNVIVSNGKDKLVIQGIRTSDDLPTPSWSHGRAVARALAAAAEQGANRRSGSNNVDKSLASGPPMHRSKSQGNTNASFEKDKLVNQGSRTKASLVAQALAASYSRDYRVRSGSNIVNPA